MKSTEKLFDLIPKLGAVEFAGLARILKVKLYSEEKDEQDHFVPRPFTDVLNDILVNFDALGRERKREILQVVKKASRRPLIQANKEAMKDAGNSEDS